MTTIIKAQPTLETTEKIGYALGDLAANLIFQTLLTFLAFFYTDVYQSHPTPQPASSSSAAWSAPASTR